jgi:hypothetical protein
MATLNLTYEQVQERTSMIENNVIIYRSGAVTYERIHHALVEGHG